MKTESYVTCIWTLCTLKFPTQREYKSQFFDIKWDLYLHAPSLTYSEIHHYTLQAVVGPNFKQLVVENITKQYCLLSRN